MATMVKFVEVFVKVERKKLKTVDNAGDVARIAGEILENKASEHLYCLHMDKGNQVLAIELLAKGALDGCAVTASLVFRGAIVNGATAIVLAHNHPSGRMEFSPEDLEMTCKIVQVGKMLGVEVLDHVLVGDYVVSLRNEKPSLFSEGTEQ